MKKRFLMSVLGFVVFTCRAMHEGDLAAVQADESVVTRTVLSLKNKTEQTVHFTVWLFDARSYFKQYMQGDLPGQEEISIKMNEEQVDNLSTKFSDHCHVRAGIGERMPLHTCSLSWDARQSLEIDFKGDAESGKWLCGPADEANE